MSGKLQMLLSEKSFVLLDGAMGTELERLGYTTTLPLWSAPAVVETPELVSQIHLSYAKAGCDILTTNTFRTTRYTMAKCGISDLAEKWTKYAVDLAREAARISGRDILVAGSIAPLEDCYEPDMVPSASTIAAEYSSQLQMLVDSGVDIILAETMINAGEAEFIAQWAAKNDIEYLISFTADENARMLDGTHIKHMLAAIDKYTPAAVLLNCRPPQTISASLGHICSSFDGAIGAYANGCGKAGGSTGWTWDDPGSGNEEYLTHVRSWIELGATIIGGCCGTTPELIQNLHNLRT